MQLEVGKKYRTRGGQCAVITDVCNYRGSYPFGGHVGDGYLTWMDDGTYYRDEVGPNDIVAEWIETIAVGDKVCVKGNDMVVESVNEDQVTLVTDRKLEFVAGRWYAQRDGCKVYCCGVDHRGFHVCYHWKDKRYYPYSPDGHWHTPDGTPSQSRRSALDWQLVKEVEAPGA